MLVPPCLVPSQAETKKTWWVKSRGWGTRQVLGKHCTMSQLDRGMEEHGFGSASLLELFGDKKCSGMALLAKAQLAFTSSSRCLHVPFTTLPARSEQRLPQALAAG